MKNLLFVLFLLPAVALSQVSNRLDNMIRKDSNGVAKTAISGRSYTKVTIDTTIPYQATDWKNFYVTVQTLDSARVRIRYQISTDASNWGTLTTKDSLSTADAGGNLKSVDLTDQIIGVPYFRMIYDFANAHEYEDSLTVVSRMNVTLADRAYADAFADTSAWLRTAQLKTLSLHTTVLDSARFVFAYQLADDTTNVYDSTTVVDSLVTTDNAGASDTVSMAASINDDSTWVRYVIRAGAGAYGQGTTTATYTSWYEKEYWVNGTTTNTYTAILMRKQD